MQERQVPAPSDEELDRYILTRYALMGIDVSVLPESDPEAPIDLERLLRNGRSILRQDAEAADFPIDPQLNLPQPYPAPFSAWVDEEVEP